MFSFWPNFSRDSVIPQVRALRDVELLKFGHSSRFSRHCRISGYVTQFLRWIPVILHPDVAAELTSRRESDPDKCNEPLGCVHFTASKPRAEWCSRPLGHMGFHMPESRYAEYRELATVRQRRKRDTSQEK
jgi:alpha-D-ribose 1-methylphosphonate 5-triphosphate synthase subunit PhnL